MMTALVLFGLVQVVRADGDLTGNWEWPKVANGQRRGMMLRLKLDGDKLSGVVVDGDTETPIEEASYKDGQVAFKVTLNINGKKVITKQSGKLDGDVIKGKIEVNINGKIENRDWQIGRLP